MVGGDEGKKDEKANRPHRKDDAGVLDQRKAETVAGLLIAKKWQEKWSYSDRGRVSATAALRNRMKIHQGAPQCRGNDEESQ